MFAKEKFTCARCKSKKATPLGVAPIPTDLGQRVAEECCQDCWSEWTEKQKQLINHFGLDVSSPDAHEFLFDQMKIFFFDEGVDIKEAEIDESQEGKISW